MKPDQRIEGLLFGCAVGDSLGLPAEGLSRERIRRRWKGVWRQRLVLGRGMISDDTEHMMMVAECLQLCDGDVAIFCRLLAWKMRLWFAALPPGIGLATARACLKLWVGVSPERSGVQSAGNGPAMRSAVIGVFFHDRPDEIERFVRACTQITHTDPRAFTGALAIARCAAVIVSASNEARVNKDELLNILRRCGDDSEWCALIEKFSAALDDGSTVEEFASRIGAARGVSGYIYQTVPVAVYAWVRHREDFRSGLESVLNCGGDTDTVGATAGSLLGLESGVNGMPQEWLKYAVTWPHARAEISEMAACLPIDSPRVRSRFRWLKQFGKNIVMLPVVLLHGLFRLVR